NQPYWKSNLFFYSSLEPQGIDPYYTPYFLPKIVAYSIKIRKNIKKEGENRPLFFVLKPQNPKT
ncbi:hypothetical protein, partial [Enterococcus gallinarum]|uniref:hypothetical protein n=1 Tax=Enterococcus gallinarum TaxID=1353 RepID=UPI001AD7CFA8